MITATIKTSNIEKVLKYLYANRAILWPYNFSKYDSEINLVLRPKTEATINTTIFILKSPAVIVKIL